MNGNGFHLRETELGDAAGLNDLYRRLTGIVRSEAQWRWEWREGPWGIAPSWVIVEQASGRVVGHHGVVPLQLRLPDGHIVSGARTENTMVDPEYRKRFVYVAYEAGLLRDLLLRYDVIITTAGKGAQAALRKRLGYHAAGTWRTMSVHAHPLYPVAAALPRPWLDWLPRRGGGGGWRLDPGDDLARVAAICARAPFTAITADRSEAFLRWRFLDHPYQRYGLTVLNRDGVDVGYLAWKRQRRGGAIDVIVDDIVMADGDDATYWQGLRAFSMAQTGICRLVLRSLDNGGALSRAMEQANPRAFAANGGTELLVRWAKETVPMSWDVTPALSQGI